MIASAKFSCVTVPNALKSVVIVIHGKCLLDTTLPTIVQNNYREARMNKEEVADQLIGYKWLEERERCRIVAATFRRGTEA